VYSIFVACAEVTAPKRTMLAASVINQVLSLFIFVTSFFLLSVDWSTVASLGQCYGDI
jgi:hypothetical protein